MVATKLNENPIDERRCFELDKGEVLRRQSLMRSLMKRENLDAIMVQGASGAMGLGGYFFWLTGISAAGVNPQTAILPKDGAVTLVRHGAFGEQIAFDHDSAPYYGIGKHIGTPTFPAVERTLRYDAELAAKEISNEGYRRVGWISPGTAYHGFARALAELADKTEFVDITEEVDHLRAVKSPVELELVRDAARMQDRVVEHLRAVIQPGMRDFEVMAEAQRFGQALGSEAGLFLGSSLSRQDINMPVRYRSEQGRTIQDGDIFFVIVENTGPGGMYTHLSRYFSLGPAPEALVDAVAAAIEAQDFTCGLLQPGASSDAVFAEYNSYMESRGFQPERRLHCHGQGYDLVERPLIRHDDPMKIAAGMNIGVHPFLKTSGAMATNCDNYIVLPDGLERVHASPREVIEL